MAFAVAQETNLTDQEYSRQCLGSSYSLMASLDSEGFNTLRINDTLTKAQTIYDSQILIERQGRKGEFETVIDSCDEIAVLHDLAFNSRDDLATLRSFYMDNIEEGMNTESIDALVNQTAKEIEDERYEKVQPLIEETYEEISRVQEEFSRLNKFYAATSQSFKVLIFEYGKYLLVLLAVLAVLYFIYHVRVRKALINAKIKSLRLRKASLKNLMEKSQKDYFQKGNISEADYQLRSKNFATLVRDIDRQVPLLEEKLIKVDNHNNKGNEIKKELKKTERKERKASKKSNSKKKN